MEATAPGKGKRARPPSPSSPPEKTSEDEQVENFYALVANIRAMRAMFKAGSSCVDVNGGEQCKERQKPAWRPVFAMEDFEDPPGPSAVDGRECKKGRRNCVKTDAAEEEGEVVEGKAVVVAVAAQLMPNKN